MHIGDLKEQLAGAASPEEVQSVMLEWTDVLASAGIELAPTKRQRMEMVDQFYRKLKESTIQVLEQENGLKVRDLPASGQVILTGPVRPSLIGGRISESQSQSADLREK